MNNNYMNVIYMNDRHDYGLIMIKRIRNTMVMKVVKLLHDGKFISSPAGHTFSISVMYMQHL